ncbi:hypothetical protein Dvina_01510 [Dactylosporangium vinaceum]|uniref:Uncharacterized protein n=1 Tax=Dactylosporangium vinaceum TaxID=53362 RepID=A0ABV5MLL0_9ACTN|nr:hypothetical protein [Dactylosporangium vinaceum]UAB96934.1 hypothetical protein Dvina_01510 [Dactylosporangium vinaceum]
MLIHANRRQRRQGGGATTVAHSDHCVLGGERAPWGLIGTYRSPFKAGGAP